MTTLVNKKQASKGIRLGWTPMKDVLPVQLKPELVTGKKLTKAAAKEQKSHNAPTCLIP